MLYHLLFPLADQFAVSGVGHDEAMVSSTKDGNETGGLFQEGSESLELLGGTLKALFYRFCPPDHACCVAFGTGLFDAGDLDGVLQDIFYPAVTVLERSMGRTPHMGVKAAVGIRYLVWDVCDFVGFAGGKHPVEG